MYYYPFYLHLLNLFTFTYYNSIDENDISTMHPPKSVDLWSIRRFSNSKYTGTRTVTATYNYYTKTYGFNGKRYVLYDDLVNDALKL